MAKNEIAVVGGGLGGLIAAFDVARRGVDAVLFEATGSCGGRAKTRVVDGFCLNQGPHALYLAGALQKALSEFGVVVTGQGPDLTNGLGLWGREREPFPLARAGEPLSPLNAEEATALQAFYGRVLSEKRLGLGVPLSEVLAPLPLQARRVVEGLIRLSTYTNSPTEIDGKAALDQLRLSFAGTIYVDGGWQSIVDGLVEAADRAGVRTRTRSRVENIEPRAGGCRVRHSLGEDDYAAVVVTVPPKAATRIVSSSSMLEAAVSDLRPVRLMALDLAIGGRVTCNANFILGFDRPVYLSVHSAVAALAPPGGTVMHVAHYLSQEEAPSPDFFESIEQLADATCDGWREATVQEQRLSGATVAHDFPRWRSAGERAPAQYADAPGVFFVGDWIGSSGMLADATAASARVAAASAASFRASVAHRV